MSRKTSYAMKIGFPKIWIPRKFRFSENFDSPKNQYSETISFCNRMIYPYIFQILTNCRFDLFLHFQMLPKSDSNSKVDFLFCLIGHVLSYQLQLKWVLIGRLYHPIRDLGALDPDSQSETRLKYIA